MVSQGVSPRLLGAGLKKQKGRKFGGSLERGAREKVVQRVVCHRLDHRLEQWRET